MAGFNDHATTVALEFLLLRLLEKRCRGSPSPAAELMDWKAALAGLKAEYESAAFGGGLADDAKLSAIEIAGEAERIANDLSARVRD